MWWKLGTIILAAALLYGAAVFWFFAITEAVQQLVGWWRFVPLSAAAEDRMLELLASADRSSFEVWQALREDGLVPGEAGQSTPARTRGMKAVILALDELERDGMIGSCGDGADRQYFRKWLTDGEA